MFFSCTLFGLVHVFNSQKDEDFIECPRELNIHFLLSFRPLHIHFGFQTLEKKQENVF